MLDMPKPLFGILENILGSIMNEKKMLTISKQMPMFGQMIKANSLAVAS